MVYKYKQYWERLHDRDDLSAVGQSGLSTDINHWIYRSIGRNVRRFAERHGLVADGQRMLEIGIGTGYWLDLWSELGWTVDGCDLVPAAVERLRRDRPEGRFWVADVTSPQGVGSPERPDEQYDLVTATSVLLHVTADDPFRSALTNCAQAVRPGGHLLLVEPALTHTREQPRYRPRAHSRARLRRSYVRPLRRLGLELVTVEAATVLAANPLEARTPRRLAAYRSWWRLVARTNQRPRLASVVGRLMYAGDAALMRTSEAPTSKILLFRKPVDSES